VNCTTKKVADVANLVRFQGFNQFQLYQAIPKFHPNLMVITVEGNIFSALLSFSLFLRSHQRKDHILNVQNCHQLLDAGNLLLNHTACGSLWLRVSLRGNHQQDLWLARTWEGDVLPCFMDLPPAPTWFLSNTLRIPSGNQTWQWKIHHFYRLFSHSHLHS
jgi:hypothetical protein